MISDFIFILSTTCTGKTLKKGGLDDYGGSLNSEQFSLKRQNEIEDSEKKSLK